MVDFEKLIDAVLSRVEEDEYKSLVWGFVDGGLSEEELLSIVRKVVDSVDVDSDVLIDELLERRLLFEKASISGAPLFRSRFAESVRLLSSLRQVFRQSQWRNAPSLVADYRVDVRPRRYPKRNIDSHNFFAQIQVESKLGRLSESVWQALTKKDGKIIELSGFQARSAEAIIAQGYVQGLIITAGTGSGKTLCFYLPVLTSLTTLVKRDNYWTKCLAVYPRIELLKDQFAEAISMCGCIASTLRSANKRPILIGSLFKETPHRAKADWMSWSRLNQGYVCPYLRCPQCNSALVWLDDDFKIETERLVCSRPECNGSIEEDQIILTRQRALRTPPDILFTTTEMVHKRLADINYRSLFGIDNSRGRKPQFILLDEVHTYVGATGAQAGMVLRRLRCALGVTPKFVGLSATLRDAERFFHTLTGLPEERVTEITPAFDEYEEEGAEYQIILQGDPASQSSLLSTTIQTSMLFERMLDPSGQDVSKGFYGCRTFAFTDNLDVTNRLYVDLESAEYQRLARFRATSEPDGRLRDAAGQHWGACEEIGHNLDSSLRVGITSSQNAGVEANRDVIVSTASLEVGYNDSQVGAVIQHKAPKGMAQYLQRKGRAGRPRGMRPWMITVLTDYGLDRVAYQNYDQLFEPKLDPQHLPIKNPYILKMQAVAAFLDWLSGLPHNHGKKSFFWWYWSVLDAPEKEKSASGVRRNSSAIGSVKAILQKLLREDPNLLTSLKKYLQRSLCLEEHEVEVLLWSSPRSLMLEALPTLQRRLFTDWRKAISPHEYDNYKKYVPLPEFTPSNLFAELNLPEVEIQCPGGQQQETMTIARAVGEVVPGRVTRRFASKVFSTPHWVPVDYLALVNEGASGWRHCVDVPITSFVSFYEPLGNFSPFSAEHMAVPVYRPWAMFLQEAPCTRNSDDLLPSSNSFVEWESEFLPTNAVGQVVLSPGDKSVWGHIVHSVPFYLHSLESSIVVRRFARTSTAYLRTRGHGSLEVSVNLVGDDGTPCALGYEQEVDGFCLEYHLPSSEELQDTELSSGLRASLLRAWFKHMVINNEYLTDVANAFLLDWLQQVYVASLISTATIQDCSVQESRELLRDSAQAISIFRGALDNVFGVREEAGDTPSDGEPKEYEERGKLFAAMEGLFVEQEVLDALYELSSIFVEPTSSGWGHWLREVLHETMAQALYQSCLGCVPRHSTLDTLIVDPEPLKDERPVARIWLTEGVLGGGGVVEALAKKFTAYPRELFQGIEAAVAPSDREHTASLLCRIVDLCCIDSEVSQCVSKVRQSDYYSERKVLYRQLERCLAERSIRLGKSAKIALNSRLLRPGTRGTIDTVLKDILEYWKTVEQKYGLAVSLREIASIACLDSQMRSALQAALPAGTSGNADINKQLLGLLWPREHEVRQLALKSYNRFRRQDMVVEPKLIREVMLGEVVGHVNVEESDWLSKVHDQLRLKGVCCLNSPPIKQEELAGAISQLLATPVDVGYLHLFPILERYEMKSESIGVVFVLWEEL